jgi:phosphoglucomutase
VTSENISPLAGKPVPKELIINLDALKAAYYDIKPDPSNPAQRVSFGTSGHRGTSTDATFQEMHVAAITQAICEYRKEAGIRGPLMLGKDTHYLSEMAQITALEVLAANNVEIWLSEKEEFTPTPAISHAILKFNRENDGTKADGIIITPSHNPPSNAGLKYNPPHGGPAESAVTSRIQDRANEILEGNNRAVKRISLSEDSAKSLIKKANFLDMYVSDLEQVLDMEAIRSSGISIGVHPLGGASVGYWEPIAERYGLKITVVDKIVDPKFAFMTVDHDGQVRMDCSSPYAMASLVKLKDQFDIAFGNDPDADRHGIVTRQGGLLNPNHYLAVAIEYLIQARQEWPAAAMIGKTIVSSCLIDKVVESLDRKIFEVPVGFKWYAQGLFDCSLSFGGEESAGASFICRKGKMPWSTDKDGLIMGLLAAEILATTGKDPYQHLIEIGDRFGIPAYKRIDLPTTIEVANSIQKLTPEKIKIDSLAGSKITKVTTKASGNNESIGGVFIKTEEGWIAIRPSGTEAKLKVYGENLKGKEKLEEALNQAQELLPSL